MSARTVFTACLTHLSFGAALTATVAAGAVLPGRPASGQEAAPGNQIPGNQIPGNHAPPGATYRSVVRMDPDSRAEKEMEVARYYSGRGNLNDAVTRFRVVVTRFPSSPVAGEALFRLAEIFLKLGIRNDAQTAAAVLNRKFPNTRWRSDAADMLRAAGLQPAEDQASWISIAFR